MDQPLTCRARFDEIDAVRCDVGQRSSPWVTVSRPANTRIYATKARSGRADYGILIGSPSRSNALASPPRTVPPAPSNHYGVISMLPFVARPLDAPSRPARTAASTAVLAVVVGVPQLHLAVSIANAARPPRLAADRRKFNRSLPRSPWPRYGGAARARWSRRRQPRRSRRHVR